MSRIRLKNHTVVGVIDNWNDLIDALTVDESIYIVKWARVHPCAWFLKHADITNTDKMLREGGFFRVKKKLL